MRLVFANEATAARRRVYFHIVDATDGITAETGEAAGQPQVSSDGAAFTNTGIGTLTHLGNGRYYADLTQTLVATAGVSIETRYKSAATAETPGDSVQVVAFNPYSTSLDILLAAANLSTDTITAAKIASDAITSAKIANNAITDQKISTSAVDKIVDQVWDEVLSGHLTAGTTGAALNGLATSADLATAQADLNDIQLRLPAPLTTGTADSGTTSTMVDAARTEADTDYWKGSWIRFTSGTISGQTRLITAFDAATDTITFAPATTQAVGTNTYEILPAGGVDVQLWRQLVPNNLATGRISSSVDVMSGNVITSTALATSAVDEIVDQVWDELIAGHLGAGSTGAALNGASAPTAAAVADAVWDEARAGHVAGGSFGEGVASVQGNVTGSVASVTGNVGGNVTGSVGSIAAGGIAAASFAAGAIDNAAIAADAIGSSELAASAVNEIADQVWEEAIADHSGTAGSTAEALDAAASGGSAPSAAVIADAVWDELRSGHVGAGSFGQYVLADAILISGDSAAADSLETMLDGTGGNVLTLAQLRINSAAAGGGIDIDNSAGPAISATTADAGGSAAIAAVSTAGGGYGIDAVGFGSGHGISARGGATGDGLRVLGGATSGHGLRAQALTSGEGITAFGAGAGHGLLVTGGATGHGLSALGGATSGDGIHAEADTVGDGIEAVGAGGGFDINADIQGNLSGSVASVTGNVGGNVVGSVGSVAAGGIAAASFAAGAIDAAAIATDAIGSAELAASAVNEIADQVWDEVLAGHLTAGTTGAALNAAGSGASAATIADAVWDELLADHVTANTMGANQNLIDNVNADTDDIQTRLPAALVGGRMDSSVGAMAADVVTAAAIATDAIGSAELAASAITEIQAGLATSAAQTTAQTDLDDIQTRLPAALVGGRMDSSVGAMAAGVVTAAAIATGAIDADALATDAVNEIVDQVWDEALAGHLTAGSTGEALDAAAAGGAGLTQQQVRDAMKLAPTAGAPAAGSVDLHLDDIEADTQDIQTRLPAALVSGRMDSSVGAMAAGVVTAAAVATDAIDSDAIAASAVTEIQAGLATSAALAVVQADTDDIQTRLPATLVGGRMRSHTEAMDAGVITATVIATDAIDADALAASALAEINTEVDTALVDIRLDELIQNAASPVTPTINSFWDRVTSKDGSQTYDRSTDSLEAVRDALAAAGPSAAVIADAVWDEALADHVAVGSMGFNENLIDDIAADTNDIQVRLPAALVGGRMDSSVGAMAAGTVTAAAIATGAIDADALATDAVNEIVDQVWDELIAGHLGAGSTGEALNTAGSGASAAAIADAVWDEALAGHVIVGSTGEAQNMIDDILTDTAAIQPLVDVAISTRATPAQVNTEVDTALADIRLDELIQNVAAPIDPTIDSFLDRITSKDGTQSYDRTTDSLEAAADAVIAAGPSAAIIADAVWDEVLAGHLTPGSTGAALDAIGDDLDTIMGPGFNPLTDSLEEIRDEVDACCGVGGGNGTDVINVEGI